MQEDMQIGTSHIMGPVPVEISTQALHVWAVTFGHLQRHRELPVKDCSAGGSCPRPASACSSELWKYSQSLVILRAADSCSHCWFTWQPKSQGHQKG